MADHQQVAGRKPCSVTWPEVTGRVIVAVAPTSALMSGRPSCQASTRSMPVAVTREVDGVG